MDRELILQTIDQIIPENCDQILLKNHAVKIVNKEVLPDLSDNSASLLVSALGLILGSAGNEYIERMLASGFHQFAATVCLMLLEQSQEGVE